MNSAIRKHSVPSLPAPLLQAGEWSEWVRLLLIQLTRVTRTLGTLQGTVLYMALDFDAPLEDFKEYMAW